MVSQSASIGWKGKGHVISQLGECSSNAVSVFAPQHRQLTLDFLGRAPYSSTISFTIQISMLSVIDDIHVILEIFTRSFSSCH